MRVGIVAESFLPNINGVTNSVLRVLEYLKEEGHEAIVIAPGARDFQEEVPDYLGFEIVRVPTVMIPLVDSLPIGVPTTTITSALADFEPDVIHLASPFVLGGAGMLAALQLGVPTVGLYQTDVAGFATQYHAAVLANVAWDWTRNIHSNCELTLAPSSEAIRELEDHGIGNVYHWGRGVDTTLFHPLKRSDTLRRQWDPTGRKKIVGFVGRLASEKGVHRLAPLVSEPGVQLVIVGDGPERKALQNTLTNAVFTGALSGEDLARAYASLDLFVHTGEFETFCQAIQEAQASGVPTIGPRAGGPIDLIKEGYNGLLLDVESFEATLVDATRYLLDDARHAELQSNARESVADKTWHALCEQLMGYYTQAITGYNRTSVTLFGRSITLPRWVQRARNKRRSASA
ncbi:glycosyltransferase family 1 protein [Corynebacterium sanguinis]|uniref:Glycosyltransferase family 1 protein n=1 Tax=Corynebacterium sanguinis TaxID=2594913 RepID=A0A6C1U349_9CORY|nr:glycosyltransferase family 1 protein [Corynebacterium sanguinis]MCT1412045.1 glycosyltransferase family 1 protein [Corynebacterium sanguinis]MCT1425740.1 glycosyltransferase family 1 protein [Corynebacterium sanguinis]MCT1444645.1 glycosyltransferase family 1 protein [Corynebacterium sanguinis]MCT1491851.1 glycosyltransferase family 1 protein [Corynebacterium sanguinis]MCT1597092.1 glycosyltransferase family 1 protein [Corynebacterium sanguinis]